MVPPKQERNQQQHQDPTHERKAGEVVRRRDQVTQHQRQWYADTVNQQRTEQRDGYSGHAKTKIRRLDESSVQHRALYQYTLSGKMVKPSGLDSGSVAACGAPLRLMLMPTSPRNMLRSEDKPPKMNTKRRILATNADSKRVLTLCNAGSPKRW